MKKIYILLPLITLLCFLACNKNDDEVVEETEEPTVSILGTWLRIAGRKSNDVPPYTGPFVYYESENTITFNPDSTIISNSVVLCSNTPFSGNPTEGIYTLTDSTYTSNDCVNPDWKYKFKQTDSILIISYPYMGISEGMFEKIADL